MGQRLRWDSTSRAPARMFARHQSGKAEGPSPQEARRSKGRWRVGSVRRLIHGLGQPAGSISSEPQPGRWVSRSD